MRRLATGVVLGVRPAVSSSRFLGFGKRTYATRKRQLSTKEQLAAEYEYMEHSENGIRIRIDPKAVKTFEVSFYSCLKTRKI